VRRARARRTYHRAALHATRVQRGGGQRSAGEPPLQPLKSQGALDPQNFQQSTLLQNSGSLQHNSSLQKSGLRQNNAMNNEINPGCVCVCMYIYIYVYTYAPVELTAP
jgi:hypothetical protein